MILFEKVDALKTVYNNAYQSFALQIIDKDYDRSVQGAIYGHNYIEDFEREFNTVVYNNMSNKKNIKAYIEKVYYDGIVSLYVKFSALLNKYQVDSKRDIVQLANGEDGDLYNSLESHVLGLKKAADVIFSESKKHDLDLISYRKITQTDYNLVDQYYHLIPSEMLKKFFYPHAIEIFLDIESRLKNENFIGLDGKWNTTKEECAALIIKLLEKRYIKKPSTNAENWIAKELKVFFERRYCIKFSKQMQHGYRAKLKGHFVWIDLIGQ